MNRCKGMHLGVLSLIALSAAAPAQQPVPAGTPLAEFAARRFPQPVRVGDLLNRAVLQATESRPVLGRVSLIVRSADGHIKIIVSYGGFLSFGRRPIAVPAEAMALLGDELEILDFTPQQLRGFPSYTGAEERLANDAIIRMGLAHPSH